MARLKRLENAKRRAIEALQKEMEEAKRGALDSDFFDAPNAPYGERYFEEITRPKFEKMIALLQEKPGKTEDGWIMDIVLKAALNIKN